MLIPTIFPLFPMIVFNDKLTFKKTPKKGSFLQLWDCSCQMHAGIPVSPHDPEQDKWMLRVDGISASLSNLFKSVRCEGK